MELECAKYHDKMPAEEARCRHPEDYCQFRTSCIIQFMARERDLEKKKADSTRQGGEEQG